MTTPTKFFEKAKTDLIKRFTVTMPKELEEKYNTRAKPSYANAIASAKAGQSAFFYSERRFKASNVSQGFQSSDELKDDLKALILKAPMLTFEAGHHAVNFVLKLWELLANLVALVVDFAANPNAEQKFDDVENIAIDLVESGVKAVALSYFASLEFGVQAVSFIVRSLFSLDDGLQAKLQAAKESMLAYAKTAAVSAP